MPNIYPGVEDLGYAAIYTGMLLDAATIPFTPGELFLGLTGYVAATGGVSFGAAYAISIIGAITGHLVSYAVGARIGHPFIRRYGSYLFLSTEKFEAFVARVKAYGPQAAFVFRFIPGFRAFTSILLGIARMAFTEFLILTFLATLLWNLGWMLLGYFFGIAFAEYANRIIPFALGAIAAGLFIWAFLWMQQRRKKIHR